MSEDNIKLEYAIIVKIDDDVYFCPDGCEVFADENQIEWIKFFPNNGHQAGKEHMVQARRVMIIRNDQRSQVARSPKAEFGIKRLAESEGCQ